MFFLNRTSNLVTNSYLKSYKQFFSIKYDFQVEIKILIYIFAFEEVQSMSVTYKSGGNSIYAIFKFKMVATQNGRFTHKCNKRLCDFLTRERSPSQKIFVE